MTNILAIALNPTVDVSSDVAHIHPTRKIRTANQRWHPGGGGVNVARVTAMLNRFTGDSAEPGLLILSGGQSGALLEGMLAELPIKVTALPIEAETRMAFMVFEEETGFEYRFVPEGPEASAETYRAALDHVRAFKGDYVVASGSLPKNAPADIYAQMALAARENGARFVLDTSGAALKETLDRAPVFLLKPSLGELETLAGMKLDEIGVVAAARHVIAEGKADYVTVTLGREGAVLVSADEELRVPARHVVVKSAVGAGDSFVAALVWYLARGNSMSEAFRFGVAAGAAAALTPGTELCHPDAVFSIFEGGEAI